jgi:hypothetical protein
VDAPLPLNDLAQFNWGVCALVVTIKKMTIDNVISFFINIRFNFLLVWLFGIAQFVWLLAPVIYKFFIFSNDIIKKIAHSIEGILYGSAILPEPTFSE